MGIGCEINSLFFSNYILDKKMKDIFKLYINGNLVDFNEEPNISFTYQQEELSNPTVVKNSFSKSININGTDNNNRIFGEIYNLDREQIYKFNTYDGAYFDPSKRTPFELYKNDELLETGYMQLTDISIKDLKIVYNITLYGGLGDFFYSLMYNEDGEKLTLADLYYKIEDNVGNVRPKETEFDFRINKDFVKASWDKLKLNASGNTINDFITFAPAYNGLYEDFENNKYLVNTYTSQLFVNNNVTVDNVTYKPFEGYLLASTETEFTEWEVRDLRSYMQRPCLKFKKLFNALCDADNNGGYTVNLDSVFFNENNPYYEKAYMALPLLNSVAKGTDEDKKESDLYIEYDNWEDSANVGTNYGNYNESTTFYFSVSGDFIANYQNDYIIDLSEIPFASNINVNLNLSLTFDANTLNNTVNNDNLYLSFLNKSVFYGNSGTQTTLDPYYTSIICQMVITDVERNVEYKSNILNFTSPTYYNGRTYTSTPDKWINNEAENNQYEYTNVFGKFVRQNNTNNYKWIGDNNKSVFNINMTDVPKLNKVVVKMKFALKYNYKGSIYKNTFVSAKQIFNTSWGPDSSSRGDNISDYLVNGYATTILYNSSKFICEIFESTIKSDAQIYKKDLLKTEFSPCDVLLDYCKLFGLYFTKDIHSKTINIMTKNSFFNNKIIDINNRIDHSQEMKIKPYLFETKYYLMKSEENESYYSKLYKNEYNLIYGQKRIDTNYNFNKDTKEIYDGSVFQNAISVTDTSPYFKTFLNVFYDVCPCWMTETVEVLYFNNDGSTIKTTEKQYGYKHWINYNLTNDWSIKSGYDLFPKTCFFNLDNNAKSLNDISSTLLFFNGFKELKDNGTVEETQMTVPYWLTDDVYQMLKLNDKQVCYLYTENEKDINGDKIAYKYTELPQFIRYYTNGNNAVESFDFGVPKEVYIPTLSYNEEATLYNKFWKNFLSDRYNVNTRKVTCYVNLYGLNVNKEMLRNFYYFNNCIWVINKIENYSPNLMKTTKVEFVKVNDTENYLNAQYQYGSDTIKLSEYEATVDYNSTTYSIDVTSNNNWNTLRTLQGYSITPTSGTQGTTTVVVETIPNVTNEYPTTHPFTFVDENGNSATFKLTQFPSPSNARFVYGYVYDKETQKPLENYELSFRNELSDEYTTESIVMTNKDGYYELWVGKSLSDAFGNVWVVILNEDNDEVYSNFMYWESLKPKEKRDFEIR